MRRRTMPLLLALLLVALLPNLGRAQEAPNRAGLVVRFGDGSVRSVCVSFAEEQISGLELLARSGISYIAQQGGIGAAVCKIGDEGCNFPAEDCFCRREGARTIYWAYQIQVDGAWRYSNLGASNVRVRNGDVQGWAWGQGDSSGGAMPPLLSFAQICGEVAAAAPAEPPPAPTEPPPAPTVAPTAVAPTVAPTAVPPLAAPPTVVPPLAAPPTVATLAEPTPSPAPTEVAPTEAPPTATATAALPATSAPTAAPPAAPPATSAPTEAPPAGGAVPPAPIEAPSAASGATGDNYLAFAAMALALLAGIGAVLWRRRG